MSIFAGGKKVAIIAIAPNSVRVLHKGGTTCTAACFAFLALIMDFCLALFFLDFASRCRCHFSKT